MERADLLPQAEISEFCGRWRIVELALFGSVLRSDFGPESDPHLRGDVGTPEGLVDVVRHHP